MKKGILWIILLVLLLSACGQKENGTKGTVYMNISAKEAKQIMDTSEGYVILDVRARDEYDQGHIPGAIVIPHTELEDLAAEKLPDLDQLILVYCRSGRRSKIAAELLVDLGYTNIREFGGILDWPYEIE